MTIFFEKFNLILSKRYAGGAECRVVQRAGDFAPMHDALRQRPAFVRAAVAQGENLVRLGAEQRDIAKNRFQNPCALGGDVV